MERPISTVDIKLPSDPNVVTPENIWSFIGTINKTGSTFTKSDLIKNGLKTKSDGTISRVLSYLKYLTIIDETRVKLGNGTEKQRIQTFKREDSTEVSDLFYELKANRKDEAKRKFSHILKEHPLYQAFCSEFFQDNEVRTFTDLEHYLRGKHPSKSPSQVQKGGEFIIELFRFCKLVKVEDGDISLITDTRDVSRYGEDIIKESYSVEDDRPELVEVISVHEPQELNSYTVSIRGPNLNATYRITSEKELNFVKLALELIRESLSE